MDRSHMSSFQRWCQPSLESTGDSGKLLAWAITAAPKTNAAKASAENLHFFIVLSFPKSLKIFQPILRGTQAKLGYPGPLPEIHLAHDKEPHDVDEVPVYRSRPHKGLADLP